MRKIVLLSIIGLIICAIALSFNYTKNDEEIVSIVTGLEFKKTHIKKSIRCKNYCCAIFVEIDEEYRQKINDMYSKNWENLGPDDIFELSDDIEISNLSGSYAKGKGTFDGLFPYIVRLEKTNTIIVIIARGHY